MKVIAINGSPKTNGNTAHSLEQMADIFSQNGIEYEIIHLGRKPVFNCVDCGACQKLNGNCALKGDIHNEVCHKLAEADGLIFGSPVYYAGMSGGLKSFMDRFFRTNSKKLAFKPVAGICVLRRSGGVETFNQINNYFALSRSLVVPTSYWSVFHGAGAGEVLQDDEGMDCAKEIATNMSWLLKTLEQSEVAKPEITQRRITNFIR